MLPSSLRNIPKNDGEKRGLVQKRSSRNFYIRFWNGEKSGGARVVVGKNSGLTAVGRNRIKRIVYALFDEYREKLEKFYIVVGVRGGASRFTFKELGCEAGELLREIFHELDIHSHY